MLWNSCHSSAERRSSEDRLPATARAVNSQRWLVRMSMLIAENTTEISAPLSVVWEKMLNWREWPAWDHGMDSARFPGSLQRGSVGKLKLKGGPEVDLRLTDFVEEDHYTSEFSLLGTTFVFEHELKTVGSNTTVRFAVTANGPTAIFVGSLVKSKISKIFRPG